jgi:hypothetical protein
MAPISLWMRAKIPVLSSCGKGGSFRRMNFSGIGKLGMKSLMNIHMPYITSKNKQTQPNA